VWRRAADALAAERLEEMWAHVFDAEGDAMLGKSGLRTLTTAVVVRGLAGELDFGAARIVLAGMRAVAPPAPVERRAAEPRDGGGARRADGASGGARYRARPSDVALA
jgi:hypothetical protein